MPIATDRLLASQPRDGHVVIAGAIADAMAGAVESEQRHQEDVGLDLGRRRAAARGCPTTPASSGAPNAQARMISGLPVPATTGQREASALPPRACASAAAD